MRTKLTVDQEWHARRVSRQLGAAVRNERRRRRISQRALAQRIGLNARAVLSVERSHWLNVKLANVLRMLGELDLTLAVVPRVL